MRVMTIYSAVVRIETVNTNSGLRTVPGILWASTKRDDIIYCGSQPSVMILYTVGPQPSVMILYTVGPQPCVIILYTVGLNQA